ncbi:substrate-binding periplasmic protein [Pseudomonas mangiferae]|uniref:Amino acid ABC transporter substrate-binding protein n=1 Tax=Pseudomonas mangiferae TaxID=2593654 RepID=A0A553GUP9_9PSED|nr:transporter substrate-binding domain-containing protein [Pseudomonas mangiferae]TRX73227.1 amino acid ABC transporter substrate-binding protein [Pseudomonas mangiferae]
MSCRSLAVLWLSVLLCAPVAWADPIRLCYEDRDSYPWSMADGSGLDQLLMAQLAEALPVAFSYVALPWRRCLDGVDRGLYDGALAASANPERLAQAVFPQDKGLLDRDKRLHTATYALYRRVGDGPQWDGERFTDLRGRIGSLSGFSIVDFLREHGAEVDETSRDPLSLLMMVKSRRIEAAALQVSRADFLLAGHPDLAMALEKATTPLQVKDYYLIFSRAFTRAEPERVREIWAMIPTLREAPAYKARFKRLVLD